MLHGEVVRITDGTPLWHDEKVARGHGTGVFEGHYGVVLVHDVRGLLFANDACEYVLYTAVPTRPSQIDWSFAMRGTK